jgi:Domain of unknown function (DUF5664)
MKFDHNKPDVRNFYWDGFSLMARSHLKPLIWAYMLFKDSPSMSLLQGVFNACIDLIGALDVLELIGVHNEGAQKYGLKNYRGLCLDRIINAMGRHLLQLGHGQIVDKSGYRHIWHIIANVYIAAELLSLDSIL